MRINYMVMLMDSLKNITTNSGIYVITNIKNNKKYIGSANNFKLRFGKHRRLLRTNKHHSRHLQNAYNMDGESSFTFAILELTTELENREQYYLDYYKSYDNRFGYNISPTAYNNTGIKRSEEYKKKKAEAHSKDWYLVISPEGIQTRTKILRYFEIFDNSNRLNEELVKQGLRRVAIGESISNTYHGWSCVFEDRLLNLKASLCRQQKIERKKENIENSRHKVRELKKKYWKII